MLLEAGADASVGEGRTECLAQAAQTGALPILKLLAAQGCVLKVPPPLPPFSACPHG